MGYFKRKLDRGRALESTLRWHDGALREGEWQLLTDRSTPSFELECFLRFSIPDTDPNSQRRTGVFQAAYALVSSSPRDDEIAAQVELELRWFEANLPVPRFDEDRAIFLFKSTAEECTRRVWSLVHLLQSADLRVEMQRVVNPGQRIYEDAYQVAVVPWSSSDLR